MLLTPAHPLDPVHHPGQLLGPLLPPRLVQEDLLDDPGGCSARVTIHRPQHQRQLRPHGLDTAWVSEDKAQEPDPVSVKTEVLNKIYIRQIMTRLT